MPWLLAALVAVGVVLVASQAMAAPPGAVGSGAGDDLFTRALARGGALLAFGAAYVVGIAACATPCVYPMIGVTVSVFGAKQAKSRAESAMLSLMFVLGIAALYTPLGLVVALTNSQWGRALSNPWVTLGLAALFATMAASMFGAFEMNLPSSVQNRLARVGGTGLRGAFLMGLVSGLIASPCTTAPFASILGSFSTSGTAVGTTSVFLFSVGLGTPFFLVGTFAARLPKPGGWMQHVKSFFGIVLLVLALFYAKNAIPALRTVAHRGTPFLLLALGALAVGLAIGGVHLAFSGSGPEKARKAIGIALGVWGGFALISWLQLEPSTYVQALSGELRSQLDVALGKGGGPTDASKPVIWTTDQTEAKATASREKRPMVIDFTADWCAACKEMEKTTFVDPRFWRAASRFVALRVDGTDEDAPGFSDYAKRFEIRGLPAVVILDSKGDPAMVFRKRVETDEIVAALEKVQ
ncbi:MAG: hypothetical protein NVS3B10_09590 [Polyangiales bacterium]